jgi:hypothetical protein
MTAFLESLSDRELVVAGITVYFLAVAVLGWAFTGRGAA